MESKKFDDTLATTVETEKALISGMWLKEGAVIPEVAEIISPDDFYRAEHRIIFAATVKIYEQEGVFNFLSLLDELQKAKLWGNNFREYLYALIDCEFTTTRAVKYAKLLREKAQKRALMKLGEELSYHASEDVMTVDELLSFTDKRLQAVPNREVKQLERISKSAERNLEQIFSRRNNPQSADGLTTGLYSLNKATGGLKKSDLIILAARPGMGKTALALNIAMAASAKVPTLMFSLEMSEKQLNDRALSLTARVNLFKIQNNSVALSDDEMSAIVDAFDSFDKFQLTIDDTGGLKFSQIRMRAKNFSRKHGLGLIVIDYLQLINGDTEKEHRNQEISVISRGLKALAKELDIPILALSQLSRNVEMRADKRPQLSDLRDSGSIEQDADIVMFLYREAYYNRDDVDKQNIAELIIAKNRNGATGAINLYFEPEHQFFGDLTREVTQ